jgi:mono/diheme cytochrome c family protein
MIRAAIASVLLGGAVIAVATAQGTARPHDPNWAVPRDARARANPLANRTDTLAGGRKLFELRCAACHGSDARGSARAPDLTESVPSQRDGTLFWKISSGNTRAGMPGFSFLPELQRWQLVQYLRSVASSGPDPRPAQKR